MCDDKKLIIEFFVKFSVFEYVLKKNGYLIDKNDGAVASPGWDSFYVEIKNEFINRKDADVTIKGAYDYIMQHPPKKQVVRAIRDGDHERYEMNWQNSSGSIQKYIRGIRNNLFHGGKVDYNPYRDLRLLESAITILDAFNQVWKVIKEAQGETLIHCYSDEIKRYYDIFPCIRERN